MLRQCLEGHEIGKLEPGTFMNRKGEWGQNLPPKLTIEDSDEGRIPGAMKTRGKRKNDAPKHPLRTMKTDVDLEKEQCKKRPRILSQNVDNQGPSRTNDQGLIFETNQPVPGDRSSSKVCNHDSKPQTFPLFRGNSNEEQAKTHPDPPMQGADNSFLANQGIKSKARDL